MLLKVGEQATTIVKTTLPKDPVGFSVGKACRGEVEAGELLKDFNFLFKKER